MLVYQRVIYMITMTHQSQARSAASNPGLQDLDGWNQSIGARWRWRTSLAPSNLNPELTYGVTHTISMLDTADMFFRFFEVFTGFHLTTSRFDMRKPCMSTKGLFHPSTAKQGAQFLDPIPTNVNPRFTLQCNPTASFQGSGFQRNAETGLGKKRRTAVGNRCCKHCWPKITGLPQKNMTHKMVP